MSGDDLPQKLRADLDKSGFGAELAALRIFHNAPLRTTADQVYFDKILNCQRQIDLAAFDEVTNTIGNFIYQTVFAVWAEVKKSEARGLS